MQIPKQLEKIAPRYQEVLSLVEPYIFCFPDSLAQFDLAPWGIEIPVENQISCVKQGNAIFFDLLHRLDGLAFGPMGMPMEKWVFFDCGEMPGGIFGFGVRSDQLSANAKKEFQVPDGYQGLVPISMYIAIPMVKPGCWFGHNLSSLNWALDKKLSGLGILTKALALMTMKIEQMYGATQWDSKALHIHLQLADMEIASAYTPAHTFANSMTYLSNYSSAGLLTALSGVSREAKEWDFLYPADDENFSIKIQQRIEQQERMALVGRPQQVDGKTVYPVRSFS
ncbi:MAG: hypothetical protein HN353_00030 [Bdellovibrionales bacterium]|jgi:hypothetical protein|nr:hypothetical protein [Bdellovibrionales bacterium]MBT3526479.1 hypothetical protein [Bdellovibrionales bacterium]MBT7765930.1 hypothetical protein [Bdellovibrionales bacterium]